MPKNKEQGKQFWSLKNEEESAELLLYGVLGEDPWWDDVGSKRFAEDMKTVRGKPVTVRINSVGGDVFTGSAIYSTLKMHDKKVTVHIDGLAASAASVVAMAGDEVIMPSNAMIMIHNPWSIAIGEAKDFRKRADDMDKIRESMVTTYQEKTGMSREELIEIMDEETWLTATEAKEYGFADTIESSFQVAASIAGGDMTVNGVTFSMERFKVLPSALVAAAARKEPKPSKPQEKPAGNPSASRTEDVMDIETLKAEHPDLYKQILDAGVTQGATDERDRIAAIQDAALPGHEELVAKAIDEGMKAETFALEVIKAEKQKGKNHLQNRDKDAAELNEVEQETVDPVADPQAAEDDKKRAEARKIAAQVGGKRSRSFIKED